MRVLLDQEWLTLREAQQLLQVNRCAINEMIETGKLKAIKIGSQIKVQGKYLKEFLSPYDIENFSCEDYEGDALLQQASQNELAMISDWT